MIDKSLFGGMVRLHILYHAAHGPVFGIGMIEEIRRHGYTISAGTLYPMLHGLEQKGYLRSRQERTGRQVRRLYDITAKGRRQLAGAGRQMRELFGELCEAD